jgi:hypothetical protein
LEICWNNRLTKHLVILKKWENKSYYELSNWWKKTQNKNSASLNDHYIQRQVDKMTRRWNGLAPKLLQKNVTTSQTEFLREISVQPIKLRQASWKILIEVRVSEDTLALFCRPATYSIKILILINPTVLYDSELVAVSHLELSLIFGGKARN